MNPHNIKDPDGVGDYWSTPFPLWLEILTLFYGPLGFGVDPYLNIFDPAPNRTRVLPGTWIADGSNADGLKMDWPGHWFLNPPWSDIAPWVDHALRQGPGIMLIPTRTDQPWLQKAGPLCRVVHIGGRVNYINPETGDTSVRKMIKDPATGKKVWTGEYKKGSISCPSSLLIFGPPDEKRGTAKYWTPKSHQARAARRTKKET